MTTLTQIAERLRKRWTGLVSNGCPIDVHQDLVRYMVDVTTNFVFDCDMTMLDRGEEVFQGHLRQILPAINRRVNAPFPYWHYCRLPADGAVDQAVKALLAGHLLAIYRTRPRTARHESRSHRRAEKSFGQPTDRP